MMLTTLYPHRFHLDLMRLVWRCSCGRELTLEWTVRMGLS